MDDYYDFFPEDGISQDEKDDMLDTPCEFIDLSISTVTARDLLNKCKTFQKNSNLLLSAITTPTIARLTTITDQTITMMLYEWVKTSHDLMYSIATDNTFISYISICDILFSDICKLVIFSNPAKWIIESLESRLQLIYTRLFSLTYELRVLICQHTHETIQNWPSDQERTILSGDIAQMITYGLTDDYNVIFNLMNKSEEGYNTNLSIETTRLVKDLKQNRPESKEEIKKRLLDDEDEMKGTAEVKEFMRQKKQASLARAKSIQETGHIWNDDLKLMIAQFPSLANRVTQKLQLDTMVLNQIGVHKILTLKQQQEKWPEWFNPLKWKVFRESFLRVMYQKSLHFATSETFRKRMDNLCYEMSLPMGTRFEHLRRVDTMYINDLPIQLIEKQLGKRTQAYLFWLLTSDKCNEMIQDPTHFFHGAAVLSMMTYDLKQEAKIRFYRDYHVSCTQVYSRQKTHIFAKERMDTMRCPTILNLCRRFYLLHDGWLLECSNEHTLGYVDSQVKWCILMYYIFKGKIEDYRKGNIMNWLTEVLFSPADYTATSRFTKSNATTESTATT